MIYIIFVIFILRTAFNSEHVGLGILTFFPGLWYFGFCNQYFMCTRTRTRTRTDTHTHTNETSRLFRIVCRKHIVDQNIKLLRGVSDFGKLSNRQLMVRIEKKVSGYRCQMKTATDFLKIGCHWFSCSMLCCRILHILEVIQNFQNSHFCKCQIGRERERSGEEEYFSKLLFQSSVRH